MFRISCDDAVKPGTYCTFNHDGVFIVIVLDCDRILAVDAEGINQFEECVQLRHDLLCLRVSIFLTFKLPAGKEMNVGSFFGCDAAGNLLIRNRIEDFLAIRKPGFSSLQDIHDDICV